MPIEITGRAHLREARKDRAINHQLKVIADRDTVVIVLLPVPNFGQCVCGGLFAGQKIKNNRRENEPCRHGISIGGCAHTGNFGRWVTVHPRTHIQSGGHAGLMKHGEKVKHASAKSFWCK